MDKISEVKRFMCLDEAEGDEQNGDKLCKRYMCTDFSGDKLMDRYQEKTGIFTEYCNICDMWDCMEYFFLCAGIGLVFVGISIFTEDAVGMGDGWLIMALGTVMQPVELFSIIFIAVMCSAVWAGITLAIFHRKGCTEIPFVPFLLIGYLGGMIL